jgi:hypothetical protein
MAYHHVNSITFFNQVDPLQCQHEIGRTQHHPPAIPAPAVRETPKSAGGLHQMKGTSLNRTFWQ